MDSPTLDRISNPQDSKIQQEEEGKDDVAKIILEEKKLKELEVNINILVHFRRNHSIDRILISRN